MPATHSAPSVRRFQRRQPGSPNQNISVSLLPIVTLAGQISAPIGTGMVSAESEGVTRYADIVADSDGNPATNRYEFTGANRLDVGLDGAPRQWAIKYDKVGTGTSAPASVTVTSSSPTTVDLPLTVTANKIQVTFNVRAAEPAGSVTIVLNTSPTTSTRVVTPTTPAAGEANTSPVIEISETLIGTPLTYTVDGDGYLKHAGGTINPGSARRSPNRSP